MHVQIRTVGHVTKEVSGKKKKNEKGTEHSVYAVFSELQAFFSLFFLIVLGLPTYYWLQAERVGILV